MHTDGKALGRMSGLLTGFSVQVDERTKEARLTADDRNHQRKSERAGASEGCWSSANAEPDRQRILKRPWIDTLSSQRWSVLARPGDVLVVANLQKELELLREERVVVVQAKSEQWK